MSAASRLAEQVGDPDPKVGLRAVAALRRLLESLEALHVGHAREKGWSWEEIGAALGVSKQAVHRKYGGGHVRALHAGREGRRRHGGGRGGGAR